MKKLIFAFLLAWAGVVCAKTPDGWTDDYEAALERAAAEKKNVLVDFTGSDWCSWCKRLDKEVFSTDEFRKAAPDKYVLLYVDSPEDETSLSEKARAQNPKLLEKYGVEGFPTILILDETGKRIAQVGYRKGGPVAFLKYIDETVREAPDIEKYIKPIEAVLNASDEAMAQDMEALQTEVAAKFTNGVERLSQAERRKLFKKMEKAAEAAFFGTLFPKYVPIYDKAFAEAHAMAVPVHMEAKKKALIEGQESHYKMMKAALAAYEKRQAEPSAEEDDEEDEEDEEEDEESETSYGARRLIVPPPELAKTEEDYFKNVAEPFYTARIVDAYQPAADVKPEVAERVRAVRRALVRALVTGREEFPTHDEFEAAHRLWREKCRDAAVAIVHCDGLTGDDRYWQSENIYKEAVAAFDFASDPFMGFLLRLKEAKTGRYRITRNKKVNRKPIQEAEVACSNAFVRVADVFRAADSRILERLEERWGLPDGAAELVGNDYLAKCRRAKFCMEKASEERGSGWGSDLTDKQVVGWVNYNSEARSNLTAAVEMRPNDSRGLMMLASLNARSCGAGDPIELMNRAVSNSLDRTAQTIERVLHFETSRWGGSTAFLLDAVRAASTNVCTRSTFAYRTAATALHKIFIAETDHVTNTNLMNAVLTPEITAGLYSMFDAYIAAPENPYMPRRDVFVGMAVALALQTRDWQTARKYAALYEKPVSSWQDAWWLRTASHSSNYLYLLNLFEAVGTNPARRELFLDAEIAMDEGRYEEADAIYRKILAMKGLVYGEKVIANRQGFKVRKIVQEAKGGWVDVMPTETAYEAEIWWDSFGIQKDGHARVRGRKCFYRLELPLPGMGAEYEAKVHFETNDAQQTAWHIGWGLARPYTGFCADSSCWSFPYIGFWRDETGDNVSVQCPTDENSDSSFEGPKSKYGDEQGLFMKWEVYHGVLEKRDTHDFRLRWTKEKLSVFVDGKEVWSVPTKTAMAVYHFRDRIQSDFSVLPVWKVFRNTSFSGYRYRLIKDDSKNAENASAADML